MRAAAIITANILGWPILQLAIARAFTRMRSSRFLADYPIYRVHVWETRFYLTRLKIRRWKRMLPDGGLWVGGSFRKDVLAARDTAYLTRFAMETRRAEAAHWLMLTCFPIFFLWNPRWAWSPIAIYAVAANAPCILVQRYNRAIVLRALSRRFAPSRPDMFK